MGCPLLPKSRRLVTANPQMVSKFCQTFKKRVRLMMMMRDADKAQPLEINAVDKTPEADITNKTSVV